MTGLYFDYNATAPIREAAWAAMSGALREPGNPSSVHRPGRQARRLIEEAREVVAGLVGGLAAGVIFTSGGTEANNLAMGGFPDRRILASAIEHPSILKGRIDGLIPVNSVGVVDLTALERLLAADDRPALVAVMLANNETGVIQPIAEVASLAHRFGALLHVDAVQAAGKIDIEIGRLGADLLALSAHKIGGPQGVGALILASSDLDIKAQLVGGGQERRHRAGTENVAGIAGFSAALGELGEIAVEAARMAALRDRLEQACLTARPDIRLFGGQAPRLPNTSCLAVPGLSAQTLLMALDLEGVAVSAGSACSSGKLAPSTVLLAMGEEILAGSAIRVSLGWATTESEVIDFTARFLTMIDRLTASTRAA